MDIGDVPGGVSRHVEHVQGKAQSRHHDVVALK
jgi:hypothetical protein